PRRPHRRPPRPAHRDLLVEAALPARRPPRRHRARLRRRRQRRLRPPHRHRRQMTDPDWASLPPAPEVFQIEVGLLQNFCEILWCPDTREAAVVDPAWEVDTLLREAKRLGVAITKILITHTHNDHIEGVDEMVAATNATVVIHPNEEGALSPAAQPRLRVSDRQDISIGRRAVRALETFGHTTGGTCYLADGYIITGDVLFVGGCGRTDFPGGNTQAMWQSLQRLA